MGFRVSLKSALLEGGDYLIMDPEPTADPARGIITMDAFPGLFRLVKLGTTFSCL